MNLMGHQRRGNYCIAGPGAVPRPPRTLLSLSHTRQTRVDRVTLLWVSNRQIIDLKNMVGLYVSLAVSTMPYTCVCSAENLPRPP